MTRDLSVIEEKELFTIKSENGIKIVNARDLHQFLESKYKFSDWIKTRIAKYDFIESIDFIKVSEKIDTFGGVQNSIEYFISLDMAKELSMVENNEKGKQARKYFIAVEKRAKELTTPQLPSYVEALRLYADQLELTEKQNELLLEQKPKVEYFNDLVERNLLVNFRDVAKEFKIKPKEFNNFLLDKKFIYRDARSQLKPYATFVDQGLFELKEWRRENKSGVQTMITPKGRETFRILLNY